MTRTSCRSLSWGVGSALTALCVLCPLDARAAGARRSDPSVRGALQRLAERVDGLERENRSLRQEVSTLRGQFQATTPAVSALQQQVPQADQRITAVEKKVAADAAKVADVEKKARELPYEIGFRTGYGSAPFGLPGGFDWNAYLNHRLVSQEDGIPYGDLTGEIAIGLLQGNHRPLTVTTLAGTPLEHPVKTQASEELAIVMPTLQYHMRGFRLLNPYFLAGPALAITVAQLRPLNAGQLPLPPEARKRGLPTVGTAHVFAGGVFGAGLKLGLSLLASAIDLPVLSPILERTRVGPEFRYHIIENGEDFFEYTGGIGIGW